MVDDQHNNGSDERAGHKLDVRKCGQNADVQRLGDQTGDNHRPRHQRIEARKQHEYRNGGHNDVGDDAFRDDGVLFDQFGQVVDAGDWTG